VLIQWLSFAVTILIQLLIAAWTVATIKAQLNMQGGEIMKLRDWRHAFGPKEMVLDNHVKQIEDHEARIRQLERHPETDDRQASILRAIMAELLGRNGATAE